MAGTKHDGKWAQQIISLQNQDGTWGHFFHGLGRPTAKQPITTEQALRRLGVLGYTIADEPIRKAVDCMAACLRDGQAIDAYSEKKHDWPLFTRMMLSAWVRQFDPQNEQALAFARIWAAVADRAFENGGFDRDSHARAFTGQFGRPPRPQSGFEMGYGYLYDAYLLQGLLSPSTERLYLDLCLSKPGGIYYVGSGRLDDPPPVFASRQTGLWLAGLEALAGYGLAKEKLGFAGAWLLANRSADGTWDLGPKANDGVYLPLSDSWRKPGDRVADCTERVTRLLHRIGYQIIASGVQAGSLASLSG
jgi:hypothetical protein